MSNITEIKENPNLEIPKKIKNKHVVLNYKFSRTPKKIFTFWSEKNNGNTVYCLDNYIDNDSPIRILYYPFDIENINDTRWEKKDKKDWKSELDWLSALLRVGRLRFGNKEVREAFFEECNHFGNG